MNIPENLKYTKDHEWFKLEDPSLETSKIAYVGITEFAQRELGDIVFVEFPNINESFSKGDIFGTIEAVKTVADLFLPITGKVLQVNNLLEDKPELINEDPYGDGWIAKISIDNLDEISELLNSNSYSKLLK